MIMARKILIMDQHDHFRHTLRQCIEKGNSDVKVIEAASVKAGFKKALKEKPNAVFLDIDLMKVNGRDIAKEIKTSLPGCGVIVLTLEGAKILNRLKENKNADLYICKNEVDDKWKLFYKEIKRRQGRRHK